MKASKQYLLWLVVIVMFCAVCLGGCGSSSDNDNAPAAQDDESGGRQILDDWEDVSFEMLSGVWKIDSTEMVLGNGVQLTCNISLLPVIMNATGSGYLSFSNLFGEGAESMTATFSGTNTDGQTITARGMPIVAGGTYTADSSTTYFQRMQSDNFVETYFIELSKSSAASSQYDIMTFMDTRAYANQVGSAQNYALTTVLHKITEGNPDIPLEMAYGNWEIVSVDLVEGIASDLTDSDQDGFFSLNESSINPNIKLTVEDNGVYWAPMNGEFTADALMGEFLRLERGIRPNSAYEYAGEVTVPMIYPLAGYTKVRDGLFRTSQVRDSNNQLNQEQVEFVGNSWENIRYTHRHYDSEGTLAYRVTLILERR